MKIYELNKFAHLKFLFRWKSKLDTNLLTNVVRTYLKLLIAYIFDNFFNIIHKCRGILMFNGVNILNYKIYKVVQKRRNYYVCS